MGNSKNDEPRFLFAIFGGADNYKKWAWEMQYFFKSVEF